MTPAMERALRKALSRERRNICPIVGVHANAEQMLIEAMDRRGFITWDKPEGVEIRGQTFYGAPRLSEKAIEDLKRLDDERAEAEEGAPPWEDSISK